MKKINKLLFTFICIFMTLGNVLANPQIGGTGEGETGNGDANTSTGSTLTSTAYSGNYFVIGMRLSFYKSDGTQLASQDYISNKGIADTIYTTYGNGTPCGKVSYGNGRCSYTGSWNASSRYQTTSNLTALFSNSGLNINIDSIISLGSLSKNNLFSQVLNSGTLTQAKNLFLSLGINPENYYNETVGAYDLFLVWEPLGRINYNGQVYIGTVYELSQFVNPITGSFEFSSGTATTGYGAVGKAITVNMGCAVNLESSSDFGDKVGQYFSSFNLNSYFGGALSTESATAVANGCDTGNKNNLKSYALSPNSAIGVGILWYQEAGDIMSGFSCSDINNYYGKNNIYSTIEKGEIFNFTSFNNRMASLGITANVDTNWYKTNCYSALSGYDCTPYYNMASCTTGGIIQYQDVLAVDSENEEYWENCVFSDSGTYAISTHKTSSAGALSYYEPNLSNKYCQVYCIESVSTNFDSNNPTVLAGSNFTWGYSTIYTTRTCKTKSIELDTFESDLRSANEEVVQQLAQQKLHNLNEGKSWIEGEDRYETKSCYTVYDHTTNRHIENTCSDIAGWDRIEDSCDGRRPTERCNYVFQRYSCTVYSYRDAVTSTSASKVGITKYASYNNFNVCTTSAPSGNPVPSGNVSAAVDRVNSIINTYNKCYDFNDNNVLNEDSLTNISYNNDVYNYTGQMDKTISKNYNASICVAQTTLNALTACSGTDCSNTTTTVKTCNSYTKTGSSVASYALTSGVYQYILKNPSGLTLKSIHSSDLGAYTSGTLTVNWINVGYSNFPVPYKFSSTGYTGELKITYSNLGHKNSSVSTTAVDTILSSSDVDPTNLYGKWICQYKVEPDLIRDNDDEIGDINVIYREIDLYSPFPDTDASNRNTGSNWCYGSDCKWNNAVSTKYILNNRGVTGEDLYDLEPMYTFIMTPSDIIQIRRYNDENSYTSYTGNYSGKNYNFKCITGTGRGCRSEYLTELMDIMDSHDNPGTCTSDRGVPTSIDTFEACRY